MTLCKNQVYVCILWQHYYARYLLLNIHIKQKIKPDDLLRVLLWQFLFSCRLGTKITASYLGYHTSFILRLSFSSSCITPSHPPKHLSLLIHHLLLPSITHVSTYAFRTGNAALAFLHSADSTQFSVLTWNAMFPFVLGCGQLSLHMLSDHLPQRWNLLCSSESPHLVCPLGESKLWDKNHD